LASLQIAKTSGSLRNKRLMVGSALWRDQTNPGAKPKSIGQKTGAAWKLCFFKSTHKINMKRKHPGKP
jgi:hypothetical protein